MSTIEDRTRTDTQWVIDRMAERVRSNANPLKYGTPCIVLPSADGTWRYMQPANGLIPVDPDLYQSAIDRARRRRHHQKTGVRIYTPGFWADA